MNRTVVISDLKSQISDFRSQILRSQISDVKRQISVISDL